MPSPNIVNQLKILWVGFVAHKSTHLNPNTIKKSYGSKTRLMNAIPDYCSTSKDVIDWLETAYSNEVNRRFIESCIGCYEWAIRTERTDANPFNRYKTHFPKRSHPKTSP